MRFSFRPVTLVSLGLTALLAVVLGIVSVARDRAAATPLPADVALFYEEITIVAPAAEPPTRIRPAVTRPVVERDGAVEARRRAAQPSSATIAKPVAR